MNLERILCPLELPLASEGIGAEALVKSPMGGVFYRQNCASFWGFKGLGKLKQPRLCRRMNNKPILLY
jgi:hypothetical protein